MGAWTSVTSVTTGTKPTKAWADLVKSSTDLAGASRPRCRYSRTVGAAGMIGATAGAGFSDVSAVNLDTVVCDNDNMTGGNTYHYVNINTAGVWMLMLTAEWVNNGFGGNRTVEMFEVSGGRHIATEQKAGVVGYSTYHYLTAMEILDASDGIQARVAQSSAHNAYFYSGLWGLSISAILISG